MGDWSFAADGEQPLGQSANLPPTDAPRVDETQWSAQARRRLLIARTIGSLLVIVGAGAFIFGVRRHGLLTGFLANGGLTLLVIGLVTIAAAVRTRSSRPDRSFIPGVIIKPRMWFILLWLGGLVVAVTLLSINPTNTIEQLVMLLLSTALMVVGSLWLLGWLTGLLARRWPIEPAAPLRLPPSWTIVWAGVWGLVSTVLAFIIEGAPVLLLALVTGLAFTDVSRSTVSPLEELAGVLRSPLLMVIVFCGAVIGAPIIEEAVKALGLRWLRGWVRTSADGWLLGLGAGLGFGVLEGAFNLDSANSWFAGSWVRMAALLLHGLTTSLTGLGYARSLRSGQRRDLWRGYRNAVILHGLWNASALGITAAAGAAGLAAISIHAIFICGGALLLVALIAFMVTLIRRVVRAGVETSVQEGFEQAGAILPLTWQPAKFNLGWRLVSARPIFSASPMSDPLPEAEVSE